jgi:hypothetical protein
MQSATQSFYSRSYDAVIRVYDEAGNVIDTQDTLAISRSGEFASCRETASLRSRIIY